MAESLIDKALRREVINTFGDPDYRPPPLPTIAIQLVNLSRREDVDLKDVVRLLEKDQVLAGIVMRLVASPLYASRAAVTSLHNAVVRIGLKKLRSIVFEATLRGALFDLPGYKEIAEQVSLHGTVTAYITRLVCQSSGLDAENGFLCGLLHDVGFSALLLSVVRSERSESPKLSALWQNVDGMHEQATGIVTRLWELPPEIAEVVGRHHHPERCTDVTATRVAAAVCVADSLSAQFNAAIVMPGGSEGETVADRTPDLSLAGARNLLGLDDAKLLAIVDQTKEMVPEILKG
jgi:HD-like signal output (HDOD) protein